MFLQQASYTPSFGGLGLTRLPRSSDNKLKNQYFADINDYRKYGLLRQLEKSGFRIGICWMLTGLDGGSDGRLTSYVRDTEKWREFDPKLFDELSCCINQPQLRKSSGPHHQDSGEAKIRESTAGVSRKP